jgi:hypothetical protein
VAGTPRVQAGHGRADCSALEHFGHHHDDHWIRASKTSPLLWNRPAHRPVIRSSRSSGWPKMVREPVSMRLLSMRPTPSSSSARTHFAPAKMEVPPKWRLFAGFSRTRTILSSSVPITNIGDVSDLPHDERLERQVTDLYHGDKTIPLQQLMPPLIPYR